MTQVILRRATGSILLMALAAGCSSPDDRLMRESLARQAEQNAQMARHTGQIAEASRQLVEADAQARGELIELQGRLQDALQTERLSLDRQHEELESERQAIARQRQREPLIAAAIVDGCILLACIAPLLLAYWVLRQSWDREPDGIGELLIQELVTETPAFLPRPSLALPQAESAEQSGQSPQGPAQTLRSAEP